MRIHNFGAGPSAIPLPVLEQAREELLDWKGMGLSVMEISHRSPEYMALMQQIEQNLRHLLKIPEHYAVLFMQGGGRAQFSMVPMNLLKEKREADYVDSGIWSALAIEEAKCHCNVNIVSSSAAAGYTFIPPHQDWRCNSQAAYLHYTSNETIAGVEFPYTPDSIVPLVSDMSSNFLSRPVEIEKHAVIYACAQKNLGMAGLTIVIVDKALLSREVHYAPPLYTYRIYADHHSVYNTPPTYAVYLAGLVLEWIQREGGVAALAKINQRKAEMLYGYIDQSGFYSNRIEREYRSRMNVSFFLPDAQLNTKFLTEAKEASLFGLKGHALLGGMRASIYNAVSLEAVSALVSFMKDFAQRNG